MSVNCPRSTSGGKGNKGMFIERDKNICAAGVPSVQAGSNVADALQHYLMIDEVNALIGDAVLPDPKPRPLPPLRHPPPPDLRNSGIYNECRDLINPPIKSKFQTLVHDVKETCYASTWKMPVGQGPDPIPMFPEGYNITGTTYGNPTQYHGRLYDIVMPKVPYPDNTPKSKEAGAQTNRRYCDTYNPDLIYGHYANIDKRGKYAKCCMTNDRVVQGTSGHTVVNVIQANNQNANQPRLGTVLAPYDNLKDVPPGYRFGMMKPPDNLPECLTVLQINPDRILFRKCLGHLNSLRKMLSTRYLPTFFHVLYLNLKYYDTDKTGWLPKEVVYKVCGTKFIRFDPALIEPLLSMWNAFDGSRIEYKTFTFVLNYKETSPEIPKIPDYPSECLDFRTTYTELTKPKEDEGIIYMAGLPSGRYLDMDYPITPNGYCKADRAYLPHESDMKSNINPSVLTQLGVSHRDMYTKREPGVVRKVFEAIGEKFTDERFDNIWEEAHKLHSQGWVSFETFRKALLKNPIPIEKETINYDG